MSSRGMRRVWLVVLCAVVVAALAVPAAAGVRYTAVTRSSHGDDGTVLVESEGPAIRIEFRDRGGEFGKGDYLVSEDGGTTLFWVEPKKRRYSEVDLDRISAFFGTLLEGIPGVFGVDIEEPKVTKLFEKEAPSLLGVPTHHVRYLMTYRERSRALLPSKRWGVKLHRERTWNHLVQDVWYTDAVPAAAHDVWLRERVHSGYEDLDRLIAAENSMLAGFPLRVETSKVAATRDLAAVRARLAGDPGSVTIKFYVESAARKQGLDYTRTATEVTDLETTAAPIAAERFEVPAGFLRMGAKDRQDR